MPVGKPAPPRPRRPEAFIASMIHAMSALGEAFLDGLVAVELDVFVDVGCALAKAAGDDFDFVGMGDEPRHYFSSFPCPAR